MSLPTNIDHRLVIKNYLQEAIKHSADKDLADTRLKAVFESVKESEDKLGFTLAEFKETLTAALDYDKVQTVVDKKSAALEVVDVLGL